MTTFYLVRHAESEMQLQRDLICGRSEASPLTTRGERQARKLGAWIEKNIDELSLMTTSPTVRTQKTLEIAMAKTRFDGRPITIDPRLHEMSQGTAEGQLRSEVYTPAVLEKIRQNGRSFSLNTHAESMNDVGERMLAWACDTAVEQGEDAHILAATHGFAVKCLAGIIRESSHADILASTVDNASVSILQIVRDEPPIVRLNTSTQW